MKIKQTVGAGVIEIRNVADAEQQLSEFRAELLGIEGKRKELRKSIKWLEKFLGIRRTGVGKIRQGEQVA